MGALTPIVLSQMPVDRLPLDQEVSRIMENNSQGISEAAMIKFSLQKSEISRLYGFLERMNYSVSKHFPGYQGVVDQLKYFKGSLPPLTPTSQPPSPP